MRNSLFSCLSLALGLGFLPACSAAPGDAEITGRDSQDLASRPQPFARNVPTFVTFAAGKTSGFDVTPTNGSSGSSHVSTFDFSRSGLDATTIAQVTSAPDDEIVLQGSVSSGTFYVAAAYRGMPGITHESSAEFYEASGSVAHALNENVTRSFAGVDVSAATAAFVQSSWLVNEVENKGALVAGHVTEATKTLTAQQVYVTLPYVGGPCVVSGNICPLGDVVTFSRDANLCYDFAGCATPTMCPLFVPACAAGYQLASWHAQPGGCLAYSCEPSFIH
jgi:hypothetical protein